MKFLSVLLSILGLGVCHPQFGRPSGPSQGASPGFNPNPINQPDPVSPNTCTYRGPQESQSLSGRNFIENQGSGKCLTFRRTSSNLPIDVDSCTWSIPSSNQLFSLQNGNGGSIIKASVSGVSGADTCFSTGFGNVLKGDRCSSSGKDNKQTWIFNRVGSLYQISQKVNTGMCLGVGSSGGTPSLVRCNSRDNSQLWKVCTVN